MTRDKIIIINRITQSSPTNPTATVIVPIRKLELSQQSQDKFRKLLTKLLLDPKKILIHIEEDNFIGKAGVISNIEVQRNFSLMQENRNYLWNITKYHNTQSSFNAETTENQILDMYLNDFSNKFPNKKSKIYFDKLIFEYLISPPLSTLHAT